jgi:cytochrome c-type biogenesis protein CcsB
MKSVWVFDRSLYPLYIAFLLFLLNFIWRKKFLNITGTIFTWLSFLMITYGFVLRWLEGMKVGNKYFPVTNLYESLVFMVWAVEGILLFFKHSRFKTEGVDFITLIICTGIMLWASTLEKEVKPLIPALQSNWLSIHVITSFIGYAAFAVGFSASIIHIIKLKKQNFLPQIETELFDTINYRAVAFGFIMLTLGIVTGAAWANYAWGSYWSWDPKETWSLITWLIYGVFLHGRLVAGWKGVKTSVISIIGFLAVIFTYLGVNLLLSGLHSYGGL